MTAIEETGQDLDLRDATDPRRSAIGTVWLGARAGFVATLVMTAFRLPISRSLPPTREFWNAYVRRGGSGAATVPAISLHLLYGTGAGVVFVEAVPTPIRSSEAQAEIRGVIAGLVYGLVLSAFGLRVVLGELLGQELDPDERLVFHLGHVVYGITLGTWLGSRASE